MWGAQGSLHVPCGGSWSPIQPRTSSWLLHKVNTTLGWINAGGGGGAAARPGSGPYPWVSPVPSHSRQDAGALELPPAAGLVIRLHEALNAVLHHTAHSARHHIGTPVPAGRGQCVCLAHTRHHPDTHQTSPTPAPPVLALPALPVAAVTVQSCGVNGLDPAPFCSPFIPALHSRP